MIKVKSVLKQFIQWCLAFIIAAGCLNIVCFAFYAPCQELVRTHGSTTGYLLPGSHGVYGLEGYCLAGIDPYGYVNKNLPRAGSYYLVAGASHTEGLFIPLKYRYSDVLNDMLGADDELRVYNIGRSGNYFSVVLQHLDGILEEFPDAEALIIETDSLAYDSKALRDSMTQTGYDKDETAEALLGNLSTRQRASMKLKQFLPLVRELHKQYLTYREVPDEESSTDILDPDFWESEYSGDFEGSLEELMAYIRSRTDKQVIILYHPAVSLEKDGSMSILTNGAEPYYSRVCAKYDIDFVDMSDRFMEAYENDHIIPRGFFNTTMGDGHINRAAHRMIAEELYKVIQGSEE
ncbi:MAG: hypothetical protein K6F34_05735 [Lachnospiraceae bacterium]|nr:hypothetical protein [Lachnospiraceae bacterium]